MKAKEKKELIELFDRLCFLRGYYRALELEYSNANEKKRDKLLKRSLNLERIIKKLI